MALHCFLLISKKQIELGKEIDENSFTDLIKKLRPPPRRFLYKKIKAYTSITTSKPNKSYPRGVGTES